jgi:hypothetical protein
MTPSKTAIPDRAGGSAVISERLAELARGRGERYTRRIPNSAQQASMTREDWMAVLESAPATPNQRGAIHGEFVRLGFGRADRAERLAVCAELLGLDKLRSTADLTMGQAGQLYSLLLGICRRAELDAAARFAEDQADDDRGGRYAEQATWAEAIRRLVLIALAAVNGVRATVPVDHARIDAQPLTAAETGPG